MINASADFHSLFLKHAKSRCCLTSVQHTCMSTFQTLNIFICNSSNATHTLHDVQHQTFCLKKRAHFARHNHGNVSHLHRSTVFNEHFNFQIRVKTAEHPLCNFHSGKNTILLYQQMRLTHGILWNTTQRGMITIANILGKSKINQTVFKFIYTQHNNYFCFNGSTIGLTGICRLGGSTVSALWTATVSFSGTFSGSFV